MTSNGNNPDNGNSGDGGRKNNNGAAASIFVLSQEKIRTNDANNLLDIPSTNHDGDGQRQAPQPGATPSLGMMLVEDDDKKKKDEVVNDESVGARTRQNLGFATDDITDNFHHSSVPEAGQEQFLQDAPVTRADQGRIAPPDVEYGELENDLAVALPIDEEEEEKELLFPTAIEYDPDAKPPLYLNRRFQLYAIGGGIVIIIVLIVAIVVSLTTTRDNTTVTVGTSGPTYAPTPPTTISIDQAITEYLDAEVSALVKDPSTPHYNALKWLSFNDPQKLSLNSTRFLQRFILALFYMQTTDTLSKPWKSCNPPVLASENKTCTYEEFGREPDDSVVYTEVPNQIRWLSEADECQWVGVICGTGEEVVGIRLVGQNLRGTLPTELETLPFLQLISLNYNFLTGTIAPEFAQFRHLLSIEVYGNLLTGEIPSAFYEQEDTSLITLGLGENMLEGTIDTRIGLLTDLKGLHLFNNSLDGPIPTEIGNLLYLSYVRLHANRLSGPLPNEMAKARQLVELRLEKNNLSGTIPSEYGQQFKRLTDCRLSDNQLVGQIPSSLFSGLSKAQFIALENNELSGTLHAVELLELTSLLALRVSRNRLTGPIPTEIGGMSSLVQLWLHLNLLTGTVPDQVCTVNSIQQLYADCSPIESPPNRCRCCTACCDQSTEICLSVSE